MVVEVGHPTGRKACCKNCGDAITQINWAWGMSWGHQNGSQYCAGAPQAEPTMNTDPARSGGAA